MITEALGNFAADFVVWLATLFPVWDAPEFLNGAGSGLTDLLVSFYGFGAWVDFNVLTACITASVGTFLVCLIIKLVLKLVGFIPGVGGTG